MNVNIYSRQFLKLFWLRIIRLPTLLFVIGYLLMPYSSFSFYNCVFWISYFLLIYASSIFYLQLPPYNDHRESWETIMIMRDHRRAIYFNNDRTTDVSVNLCVFENWTINIEIIGVFTFRTFQSVSGVNLRRAN